jgi:hypothetical protein
MQSDTMHARPQPPDTTKRAEDTMTTTITIIPNEKHNPPGKLADAELHVTDGLLAGLKLIGFGVWERSGGGRHVTFPSRSYSVNGERRTFALLRPTADASAQETIRLAILAAYDAWASGHARQAAPTLTVSPSAQAALDQVAADLTAKRQAAPPSPADVAATHGQYIATARGPVSDRSLGTAADYGSRGDAPEPTDWTF